jgi:hypothetical protein
MSTPTTSTSNPTLNQGSQPERKPGFNQPAQVNGGDKLTSGMAVDSQIPAPVATYVHGHELDGDRGGDTRKTVSAAFSTDFAKNPPGPREPVRQSQVTSSKLIAMDAPVPVPVTGESLASNS